MPFTIDWDTSELKKLADQVADRYGIPRQGFRELITDTSNWDPDSVLEECAGIGHLYPEMARMFGLVVNDKVDERFDPEKSLDALARCVLAAVEINLRQRREWNEALKELRGEGRLVDSIPSLARKDH